MQPYVQGGDVKARPLKTKPSKMPDHLQPPTINTVKNFQLWYCRNIGVACTGIDAIHPVRRQKEASTKISSLPS